MCAPPSLDRGPYPTHVLSRNGAGGCEVILPSDVCVALPAMRCAATKGTRKALGHHDSKLCSCRARMIRGEYQGRRKLMNAARVAGGCLFRFGGAGAGGAAVVMNAAVGKAFFFECTCSVWSAWTAPVDEGLRQQLAALQPLQVISLQPQASLQTLLFDRRPRSNRYRTCRGAKLLRYAHHEQLTSRQPDGFHRAC